MGFILSIVAQILFIIVSPFNFIAVMCTRVKEYRYYSTMSEYWFQNALETDIVGNYKYRTFWNLVLRTKEGYKFGVRGETISSALGKNQRNNTLSLFGWVIVYILWAIDKKYWKLGGHCINSIQESPAQRGPIGGGGSLPTNPK